MANEARGCMMSLDAGWSEVAAELKPSKVGQTFLNWLLWRSDLELAPAQADELDCEGAFLCLFLGLCAWSVLHKVDYCSGVLSSAVTHLSCLFLLFASIICCSMCGLSYIMSWVTNLVFLLQNCVKFLFFILLHSHTEHHKSCCTNSIWHIWRMIFWTGFPIRHTSEARTDRSR